jgi:hypothetical protein
MINLFDGGIEAETSRNLESVKKCLNLIVRVNVIVLLWCLHI